MSSKYGFFNGMYLGVDEKGFPVYDRAYDADDVSRILSQLYTNGILWQHDYVLKVQPASGFILNVDEGTAFINGRFFELLSQESLRIERAVNYTRYDRIVLRLDAKERKIYLAVLEGEEASNSPKPELTQYEDIYELGLALIKITPDASKITAGDIIDTRDDVEVCGKFKSKW